jgi:hypothetical protein
MQASQLNRDCRLQAVEAGIRIDQGHSKKPDNGVTGSFHLSSPIDKSAGDDK